MSVVTVSTWGSVQRLVDFSEENIGLAITVTALDSVAHDLTWSVRGPNEWRLLVFPANCPDDVSALMSVDSNGMPAAVPSIPGALNVYELLVPPGTYGVDFGDTPGVGPDVIPQQSLTALLVPLLVTASGTGYASLNMIPKSRATGRGFDSHLHSIPRYGR